MEALFTSSYISVLYKASENKNVKTTTFALEEIQ
jgi:hypothetical protein